MEKISQNLRFKEEFPKISQLFVEKTITKIAREKKTMPASNHGEIVWRCAQRSTCTNKGTN